MDGWRTALAFFAEDDPATRFRPGGLTSIRAVSDSVQSWTRKSPFERKGREKSLLDGYKITVMRYFAPDNFFNRMMEAVCDSWVSNAGKIGPVGKTSERLYSLDVQYPDGSMIRYSGMALKTVNLLIQSGRIVSEESIWVPLKAETLDSLEGARPESVKMTPAALAGHYLDTSLPAVTSADWPDVASRVFSSQIIFERDLYACNYKTTGEATRHVKGAWEITGQGTMRLPPSDFSLALNEDTEAALFWKIAHPELASVLNVAVPNAIVRVNNQEALAGEIEHTLDFHAKSVDNDTAFISL